MNSLFDNVLKKVDRYAMVVLCMSITIGFGYSIGKSHGNTIYDILDKFDPRECIKDFKRLTYYFNKSKTFYFDSGIHDWSVHKFKKFMNELKDDDEIDIVIETNGGSFSCGQMISNMIVSHKGQTNALVLNNAFSAGTLIALSCKTLYMHKNANLSPVDVVHSSFFDQVQLSSIQSVINNKCGDRIDDKTFMLADQAKKCMNVLYDIFDVIIKSKYDETTSEKIKEEIFAGEKYTHCTAFSVTHLKKIGINVKIMDNSMIEKCKLVYD